MKIIGPIVVVMSRMLPLRALDGLTRVAAWIWWCLLPVRRDLALDNLARAGGVPQGSARGALLRRHVRELLLGYLELVRWRRRGSQSGVRVEIVGLELLRPGTVALVGHLGAWDLGILAVARSLAARPEPLVLGIHVRVPNDAWSRAMIEDCRAWAGLRTLAPSEGMSGARRVLDAGGAMAFAHDQAFLSGPSVPFLGRPAHTSTGFARASFACTTTVGAWISRIGVGHHVVTIESLEFGDGGPVGGGGGPPLRNASPAARGGEAPSLDDRPDGALARDDAAVLARTRFANAWLEARVRAEPHAWLWLHRRWKER